MKDLVERLELTYHHLLYTGHSDGQKRRELLREAKVEIERLRERTAKLEAVAIAAKGLVSRGDFWSGVFTPGEFDDVIEALAALPGSAIPTEDGE